MLKVSPRAALWSPDTAHLTRRHTHTLTHCGVFWVPPVASESREGPKIQFKVRFISRTPEKQTWLHQAAQRERKAQFEPEFR